MMMDVVDLRNELKNLEEKQAYVKWWARQNELDLILDKLNINFDEVKDALDIKNDLYCIYLGSSTNGEIGNYLNYQLNGKHTKSTIQSGLSTFRRSVASIVSFNQADEEGTNEFLDKLKIEIFYIEYPPKSSEAKNEIERIVNECLEKNLYLLNINGNNHYLAKNTCDNLKQLRKESLKNAENYFSSNDSVSDIKKTSKKLEKETNGMWFITAGRESAKFDIFKKRNFVAIRWDLGDLTGKNKKEIEKKYIEIYGVTKSKGQDVSQINKFVNEIHNGDFIITSKRLTRSYLIGKCTSDYFLSENLDNNHDVEGYYKNCRHVEWFGEIGWEDLCTEAKDIIKPKSVYDIKKSKKEEFLTYLPISIKETRNKIYFGAPGTGKSYNLNIDKENLLVDFKDNYERVTFHPDYTYANFVGTYKPVPKKSEDDSKNDSITYKYVPGPFMRTLVKSLKNPFEPFVLIIEEINRANVAAVFGDVFQLLDRNNFKDSKYPLNASEDINKYLTEVLDISKISDDKKCIIDKYWKCKLGEHFEKIIIPKNMFIWATMNSADQGVFPMDTAFKRRWEFEYLGIDDGVSDIKDIEVYLDDVDIKWKKRLKRNKISWNDVRVAINEELLNNGVNEDKLLGPFFAFTEYIKSNKNLKFKDFEEIFKNKILMYLFEDVAKYKRKDIFYKENITYSQLRDEFELKGFEIFSKHIQDKLLDDNNE